MAEITRYDAFQEALSLRNAMDQLFARSFVYPNWMGGSESLMAPMDVCETDNGYEVDISLPGLKPEDIDLTVEQNTLTVKGHYDYHTHHQEQQGQYQNQPQGQKHDWLRREIRSGSFQRTVTLPKTIDANNIQANYDNGILTVLAPFSETSRARKINVSRGQSQPQHVTVEAGKQ
jgi:HSP20 family protein